MLWYIASLLAYCVAYIYLLVLNILTQLIFYARTSVIIIYIVRNVCFTPVIGYSTHSSQFARMMIVIIIGDYYFYMLSDRLVRLPFERQLNLTFNVRGPIAITLTW